MEIYFFSSFFFWCSCWERCHVNMRWIYMEVKLAAVYSSQHTTAIGSGRANGKRCSYSLWTCESICSSVLAQTYFMYLSYFFGRRNVSKIFFEWPRLIFIHLVRKISRLIYRRFYKIDIPVIEDLRIWENKNSHTIKFIFPLQPKLLKDDSGSSGCYFL